MGFIKHHPCEKCHSRDNLAEYSNGFYCFGCGWFQRKTDIQSLQERIKPTETLSNELKTDGLYDDLYLTEKIAPEALKWLLRYIPMEETKRFSWEPEKKWLMLYKSNTFYQARDFSGKRKYINCGKKPFVIYSQTGKEPLVFVEDVLSAIKVELAGGTAVPMFGSSISWEFPQKEVMLWFDRDKATTAIKYKNLLQEKGKCVKLIITDLDCKEYYNNFIKSIINKQPSTRFDMALGQAGRKDR